MVLCGLEERTRFSKKIINLIAAKSGLVGMKAHLKTYNHVKYFLPYLSRFCMRPFFTPNFSERFSGPKPKSRELLPRILIQTKQIINLKLAVQISCAKPNRSPVIRKSLKLRTR